MKTLQMPVQESSLIEILRCPKCHSSIQQNVHQTHFCTNLNCTYHQEGFLNLGGQPVLVDFDRSVFSLESYQQTDDGSVLDRKRSKLHQLVYGILWGKGKTANHNLKIFIEQLLSTKVKPTILVVGGGAIGNGVAELYTDPRVNLIGFDVYSSSFTDFVADAHDIPLKEQSVDGVWIQYVLEHVLEPDKVAAEIHRVLKPGGLVYAETPFLQHVHEKAYDFTRFTESGHRWLFRYFELLDSGAANGPGTVLVWSLRSFIGALLRSKKIGKASTLLFFWLRFFDYLMPESYKSDGASGVYFMGRKVEHTIQPDDIIAFYRGVQ
jgi:SAM-dependent methyltransferase